MERFQGKLLDGEERLLFESVSGVYEEEIHRGARFGLLEVHEGSAPLLATHRPYRLVLDDGRAEEIFITGLRQSGTAGVTTLAFQVPGGLPEGVSSPTFGARPGPAIPNLHDP